MRWSTGEAVVERLLGQGGIEQVQGDSVRHHLAHQLHHFELELTFNRRMAFH